MAGAEQICEALKERSFSAIGLVLNDRGLDRALKCDLDEINVVAYAADGYAQKNSGASAAVRNTEAAALVTRAKAADRRTSVTIAVAFGDPIDGTVALEHVADLTATFAGAGADEVALGDTIGIANPKSVERLIPAVIDAAAHDGAMPLSQHPECWLRQRCVGAAMRGRCPRRLRRRLWWQPLFSRRRRQRCHRRPHRAPAFDGGTNRDRPMACRRDRDMAGRNPGTRPGASDVGDGRRPPRSRVIGTRC